MSELKSYLLESSNLRVDLAKIVRKDIATLKGSLGLFDNPFLSFENLLDLSSFKLEHYRELSSIANALIRISKDSRIKDLINYLQNTNSLRTIDKLQNILLGMALFDRFPGLSDIECICEESGYSGDSLITLDNKCITISYINTTKVKVPSIVKKLINRGFLKWRLFDFPNACDARYIKDLQNNYNEFITCVDVALSHTGLINNFNVDMEHDYVIDERCSKDKNFLIVVNNSLNELGEMRKFLSNKNILMYRIEDGSLKCNNPKFII